MAENETISRSDAETDITENKTCCCGGEGDGTGRKKWVFIVGWIEIVSADKNTLYPIEYYRLKLSLTAMF